MSTFANPSNTPQPEAPLRVNQLSVHGTEWTRQSFLNNVLKPLFDAQTTDNVLKSVQSAAASLQRHDIFEEIKVYLQSSKTVPDTVDISLQLKEKPKASFATVLGVRENEANMNGSVSFRNLFGGAESLSTSYSFGNRTKAAFETALGAPVNGSPDVRAEVFVRGAIKDFSMVNYYVERSKAAGIRFKGVSVYGDHALELAFSHRDVVAQPKSSATVRAASGENTKASVHHAFVHDKRDHAIMPSAGHYIGVFSELAGVGQKGDSSFTKHEVAGQFHHTLFQGQAEQSKVVLSVGAKAGLLATLDNDKPAHLSDKYFLGGPLSVRGFRMGGIGPRDGNDALGGEAFWAAGASLVSSIPGASHLPIKAHAFFNAGNLVNYTKGSSVNDTIQALSNEPRTSAGVGLIFYHHLARIEANFCVPLRFSAGDLPQPGVQFGLGVNFL
ncbi:surface antigen-domain-containing protein [Syncephalastrum racemosum]|uniref:Surface antigen-domain-containing protein n=1 Tax=Syncephalastrum racemosum TaxID=13706 RepID=A0A1X2HPT9_SYNRA|nr:surface antigen-domain-containing protein [Syncephalastrum racemosum]